MMFGSAQGGTMPMGGNGQPNPFENMFSALQGMHGGAGAQTGQPPNPMELLNNLGINLNGLGGAMQQMQFQM